MLPGRRRSTGASSTTPTAHATTSRRCGSRVTGAAAVPVELVERIRARARLRDGRHRLRAHRDDRHRDHVPPRRRPRDHRHYVGPGDPRHRGAHRRRRRQRGAAGEPGEIVVRGLQRDARLLRGPRGDGARRSTPTAGCTPATSACMDDARLRHASPTARRTCSSSAASTRTRPRSRTCCSATTTIAQVAVVGVPDERMGEVGMAFVVPRPGATVDPDEVDRVGARAHGQLQGARAGSRSSTSCRSTQAARC